MKHERFEIARDNHSEEDYYTENGIQHLNTYLGDAYPVNNKYLA